MDYEKHGYDVNHVKRITSKINNTTKCNQEVSVIPSTHILHILKYITKSTVL